MKILYLSNVHYATKNELGVLKKVVAQCNQLSKFGNNVILSCFYDKTSFVFLNSQMQVINKVDISRYNKLNRTKNILRLVSNFIEANNVELIYSRFSDFSYDLHIFYLKHRRKGVRTLLEIPTYPITQRWLSIIEHFRTKNYYSFFSQIYSSTIGSIGIYFFKYSIDRIVNVNGYQRIWGIPVINITNGIDVSKIEQVNRLLRNRDYIRVISVANIANWHGYDRFINGLDQYYKSDYKTKVYFDIVGPGNEADLLKELVKKLELEDYVIFHGQLFGTKLDALFADADIGISVLGVHRNNSKTCDSLKAREFCARRLPFITEKEETHFIDKPFVKIIPSDDSPVNIQEIVEFHNTMKNNPEYYEIMYDYAMNYCDWNYAFKNVINYIDKLK